MAKRWQRDKSMLLRNQPQGEITPPQIPTPRSADHAMPTSPAAVRIGEDIEERRSSHEERPEDCVNESRSLVAKYIRPSLNAVCRLQM